MCYDASALRFMIMNRVTRAPESKAREAMHQRPASVTFTISA